MDTIILDWGALSQILQQSGGQLGALEQALQTSGSQLAVTNYGLTEISTQYEGDFEALKNRLNISTITIGADFSENTLENRQLGVHYDDAGNPASQLGDASYRWLEQNEGGFSDGTYRLLTNDRGLINEFSDINRNSVLTTNLDLIGRALLRGDISADEYRTYIKDFALEDGTIRGISSEHQLLVLDEQMLSSIEKNKLGGIVISDKEFVDLVTNSKVLAAAGIAGDVFGLSITILEINGHIKNGDYDAAEVVIAEFAAGVGGGIVGALGSAALAGLLAPEFFSSAVGGIVLLGIAALGGYAGGEIAEAFANELVTALQEKLANGEALLVDDVIAIRDQFFADNNLDPDEFELLSVDGTLSVYQHCFCPETSIAMWPTTRDGFSLPDQQIDHEQLWRNVWHKPIEEILPGDRVVSFDALGVPVPGVVTGTKRGVTNEWLKLIFEDDREPIHVTPGHRFLTETGDYLEIGKMLRLGGGIAKIVLHDGRIHSVQAKRIDFSSENAHNFQQSMLANSSGSSFSGTEKGWITCNFEVRDFHNYIAGGVRVHNDSVLSFLTEFEKSNLVTVEHGGDGLPDFAVVKVPKSNIEIQ